MQHKMLTPAVCSGNTQNEWEKKSVLTKIVEVHVNTVINHDQHISLWCSWRAQHECDGCLRSCRGEVKAPMTHFFIPLSVFSLLY